MTDLKGKVVLITGASSGIGASTAVHFATLGCKLSVVGRNEINLEKTIEACTNAGTESSDILKMVADISKEEEINKIIKSTIDYFGRLNVLVNNAGIMKIGTAENTAMEIYDETMNVNVRSLFLITQLAIPHLKKTKGNIVNVSSVAGLRSFPGVAAYCVSKAAVDQLTRCTALELASDGVRVNSVNPGVIITELHKRGGMAEEVYVKFLERCKGTHALGRPGTVDEVAEAIIFLADENKSSFITGVNLPVDGGRGVMCPR
ncbi:uncharacterized oxidoreductase TM_0325-like [Stegodyphus dumicola]|uniref:uncharacterized oxidoreductase TM_0325-like n=1 Tax=Stegodyphus dumicola TaxID=202533 RepID=UPI0015B269C0|nr:uncharacterized oxidoreductase TM_0325-like [Stegodyphus dumicola]XP_035226164.1 uncharacterized oxidoreductase TM_0325-like [Stegodyphus dumicola]